MHKRHMTGIDVTSNSMLRRLFHALGISVFEIAIMVIVIATAFAYFQISPIIGRATAQEGVGSAFDLGPIISQVLLLISGVLGAIGIWVLKKVNNWLEAKTGNEHLDLDSKYRDILDAGIMRGVQYAVEKVEHSDWTKIETKNAVVAEAVNYALLHFGDILKWFKIDNDRAAIERMVLARVFHIDDAPNETPGAVPPGFSSFTSPAPLAVAAPAKT